MTDNRIVAEGAPNLRDLGGYPAADGKRVVCRQVYRSDDLYDLSDDGLAGVDELGICCVVDFRTRNEALLAPDRVPSTVKQTVTIPIDAGRLMTHYYDETLNARKTRGIMVSVYRALASDFQPAYRQFFALLADPENIPLLFHCTAGKDRTGFAAAMFLSALGVERDVVVGDYLLSVERLREKYVEGVDYDETTKPLFQVEPAFIDAAFDIIDSQYGGVESYLTNQLHVDIPLFRQRFTE
ncbi:MAG: tyrosine-protein phosphatase [Planctomycetaceae bacterium]|nr:tyrosine-protein phosphatase [Planctomycetaceae bacterium]